MKHPPATLTEARCRRDHRAEWERIDAAGRRWLIWSVCFWSAIAACAAALTWFVAAIVTAHIGGKP